MSSRLEFYIMSGLLCFLGLIPKDLSVFAARTLARIWFLIDGKHRRKILRDIDRTPLRELDAKRKEAIAKGVYLHLGTMLAEVSKFRKWSADKVSSCIAFTGGEALLDAVSKGKGALLITAHLGNWELAGMALPLKGVPISSVARPIRNTLLDETLNRLRTRFGQRIMVKFNVMLEIIRELKDGRCVGMLIDQDAERDCFFVPFLGEIAGTVSVPAKLAVKYKLPVFCVTSYRIAPFSHRYRITGPINFPTEGDDAVRITTEVFNNELSEAIMEHPEQWLWLHHRWRGADKKGLTRFSAGAGV
ncbi:MAG: hypothetical protein Kow00107_10230 [Planctomycetota bacterium]